MKKGTDPKKKGMALFLSAVLLFSSLSLGANMRAFAAEDDSITFLEPYEFVYTGSDHVGDIKTTVRSERTPSFQFYQGNVQASFVNAGEYRVVASLAANGAYNAAGAEHTFVIKPASIADCVIGTIADQTYTGDELKPEPSVTFKGETLSKDVDYSLAYYNNIEPGTANVILEGTGNFNGVAVKNFTIKLAEKNDQVFEKSFSEAVTKTYGDSAFTKAAVLETGDGTITYESSDTDVAEVDPSTGRVTIKHAGSAIITARAAATDRYNANTISYDLTVEKAAITVETIEKSIKQGDSAPSLDDPVPGEDYTVSGLVGNDSLRGEITLFYREEKDGASVSPDTSQTGSYEIAARGVYPPSDNYHIEYVFGRLYIDADSRTAQIFEEGFEEAVTKTYGDSDFTQTAALRAGNGTITYKSSDTSVAAVDEDTGRVSIQNAGSAVITATAGSTERYRAASVSYTLTVNRATITVKALDRTISQGERAPSLENPGLGEDYTVSGLVGSDSLDGDAVMSYQRGGIVVGTPNTTETGTYEIVISGFSSPSENYNETINYLSGTLTIQRSSGGIGTPVMIMDGEELRGWAGIVSELEEMEGAAEDPPEIIEINMNGSTVIIKELLDAIRGKRIFVRLLYGNGVTWSIDGRDVDLIDQPKNTDLGVKIGGDTGNYIPDRAIKNVKSDYKKGKDDVRMRISNYGYLGFAATLSVNVAKSLGEAVTSRSISRYYGLVANLYSYDPVTQKLEFRASDYIDDSGSADFGMDYTYNDYVVVLDGGVLGGTADVMRVYNPNSGRHHFSLSWDEINGLISSGWRYEGIAFTADTTDKSENNSSAVYRLYNPNDGQHLFTTSLEERNSLTAIGWQDEGIAWYGNNESTEVPVFRFYNPNTGDHHYTANQIEVSKLVVAGWKNEGIAFYAADVD